MWRFWDKVHKDNSRQNAYRRNGRTCLCIERADNGESKIMKEQIMVESSKTVNDLLEISRSKLMFEKDAVLSAYRKKTDEYICNETYIWNIADYGTVLIKQTRRESRNKDVFKENEKSSSRNDRVQMNYRTTINVRKHVNRYVEEIETLNIKLNLKKIGFMFQIVPMDYEVHEKTFSSEIDTFYSEKELQSKDEKISSTYHWSSWQPDGQFPCWGVRVSENSDQSAYSSQNCGNTTYKPDETRIAIVTKTNFREIRKFSVQVTLDETAISDAKEILKAKIGEQRHAINSFNNKYCNFVYCGQFSAGSWFRKKAFASCKTKEFATLVEEARLKLEADGSGCGFSDGKARQLNRDNPVYGTVRKTSDPVGISSEHDMEKETSNVRDCTVFPALEAKKSHFTPVYEIMGKQAEATGDKELAQVSAIMKMLEATQKSPLDKMMEVQAEAKAIGEPRFHEVSTEIRKKMKGEKKSKSPPDDVEKMEIDYAEDPYGCSAQTSAHMKGVSNSMRSNSPHYVVVLGDVGTGKSTVVEKLTGQESRSSDASESFTRISEYFYVPDGSIIISDTPGSNSRKDKLQHNVWIATALNHMPVSKIFIVVRAEHRIDSVIDSVLKYADNFVELPFDVVGVLVTHMDKVNWAEEEFIRALDDELGIDTVVFSSIHTKGATLLANILNICTERHDLTVNDKNVSKLFKINNSHRKVLQFTSDEVKKFSRKKNDFDVERKAVRSKNLQVDLAFEFQAYMTDALVETQKRMIAYNNFTFEGENAALEGGHVLNMLNQLNMVLHDVRIECTRHNSEHGVSGFRKCPYCGLIWTKKEGCSGNTTCVAADDTPVGDNTDETKESTVAVLGTFSFTWTKDKLLISESGNKSRGRGCGKVINWEDMAAVNVPPEFVKSAMARKTTRNNDRFFSRGWNIVQGRVYDMKNAIEKKMGFN